MAKYGFDWCGVWWEQLWYYDLVKGKRTSNSQHARKKRTYEGEQSGGLWKSFERVIGFLRPKKMLSWKPPFLWVNDVIWGWLGEAKVSCILRHRGANWYWLIVGQGLLSLQQVRVEGECFYFFCFFTFIIFLSPLSLFHLFYYLFCLSSPFSLGYNTNWLTRFDVSCNPNSVNQMTS